MRSLMVLRHAQTEDSRPGSPDRARRLTPDGERQAAALGDDLRRRGVRLDVVLCSPATRVRQTVQALRINAPVAVSEGLYGAGGDEIIAAIRELADDVMDVLVVGHAPALPSVVYELADPDTSDPEAMAAIESRFPAGTLATLIIIGPWSDVDRAALVSVRLP